ncbi:MAG TPA: S1 RNA-binding domain-containing protein [Polyangiaceae bacterium]
MAGSPLDDSFAAMFESAPKQGFARRHRVGDVLDLEVVGVGPEAVLVALDGKQEGFIPASELVNDEGKATVRVGSRVAVRVAEIDRESGEVRLSAISRDPVVATLSESGAANDGQASPGQQRGGRTTSTVVGMLVKGKVTGVERYGVFVEYPVAGGGRPERGLVPAPELGTPRGADLRKLYPIGTELEAAVIAIDERGRVRLSVTALSAAQERREFETYEAGDQTEEKSAGAEKGDKPSGKSGAGKKKPETGRNASFGTFADLLKKK